MVLAEEGYIKIGFALASVRCLTGGVGKDDLELCAIHTAHQRTPKRGLTTRNIGLLVFWKL